MRVRQSSPYGRKRRRGVYVLPSFITLANMFFGFYAMIFALQGRFMPAAYLLIIAGFLDLLDGRIARLTKTQTDFGKELDSLTDIVSFGVMPALIVYLFTLQPMGRLGWLLAFFYAACGAIRLARFNLSTTPDPGAYFTGLPITAAAGLIGLFLILLPPGHHYPYIIFILACAMVSSLPYPTFKNLDVKAVSPTYTLILLSLLFIIIAYKPIYSLFVLGIIYFLSGPFLWVWLKIKERKAAGEHINDIP